MLTTARGTGHAASRSTRRPRSSRTTQRATRDSSLWRSALSRKSLLTSTHDFRFPDCLFGGQTEKMFCSNIWELGRQPSLLFGGPADALDRIAYRGIEQLKK